MRELDSRMCVMKQRHATLATTPAQPQAARDISTLISRQTICRSDTGLVLVYSRGPFILSYVACPTKIVRDRAGSEAVVHCRTSFLKRSALRMILLVRPVNQALERAKVVLIVAVVVIVGRVPSVPDFQHGIVQEGIALMARTIAMLGLFPNRHTSLVGLKAHSVSCGSLKSHRQSGA